MKTGTSLIAIGLAATCGAALATEYGNVITSTAAVAQIAVPQQQCTDQQVSVQPRTSGGGALLGAVIGGVVGHNVGQGFGRAAATGVGVVAGGVIGDRVEAGNTAPTEATVRNCQTVTSYENRIVGYDVAYEYNGLRYSARMAQEPGARIPVNVVVTPLAATVAAAPPPVVYATPVPVYYGPGQRRHGY